MNCSFFLRGKCELKQWPKLVLKFLEAQLNCLVDACLNFVAVMDAGSTVTSIGLCKLNPLKQWMVRLLISKLLTRPSIPIPEMGHFARHLMLAIVSFKMERALGSIKSFCWKCMLSLPRIWNMSARKCQNATKEASFIAGETFNALSVISALGDVDAKCSICCRTAAYCDSSLIISPSFTGLMNTLRALLTYRNLFWSFY